MSRNTARSVVIRCLLTGICITITFAQQSTTVPNPEEEFFNAIRKGDSARVTELLKQQPSLIKAAYRNNITPVLFAVYVKHPEIAELLISNTGIELNIFEATATGRLSRVKELLRKDPTLIHAFSADGWTPLHLNWANLEMARLLIDAGADLDVNSRNKLNATPLQGAAANNWIDLAKLYLSRGAKVNCRSEGGATPLHEAAGNGFLEFARLLLANGANVNQRDDSGTTPLGIAIKYERTDVADLLRQHGGTQ